MGIIVKHKDGRLSRWNWKHLPNGNILLNIIRFDSEGYYQAQNSTTSEENENDFRNNLEALRVIDSIQVIPS